MLKSACLLAKHHQKTFAPRLSVSQQTRRVNFNRDYEKAPKIPVLEAVKEKIVANGGFSTKFKSQVCISMVFQGYGTNASLLHSLLELGFPRELIYVATKPHTTNAVMRDYFKKIGVHYFDFCDYSYQFLDFKFHFMPGTYPAGYYYDAISQYYNKMIQAQRQDFLRNKRYPEVKFFAVADEGAIYEQEYKKVEEKFKDYYVVALGHSTSDLSNKINESLSHPKISMGGAAIKTIIEAEEIALANLSRLEEELSKLPHSQRKEIRFGIFGCGNIGQHTIHKLLENGKYVFYYDVNTCQYEKLQALSNKYSTQINQAQSAFDLFQNSDIILSCVGQDTTNGLHYSQIQSRVESPIEYKLLFNFASGEREFSCWIRQSQNKENPVIVDPNRGVFPDYVINNDNGTKLIIKFSGMPANMMAGTIHGLPPEKAQIIRGMKLAGIYQLDQLINEISTIPEEKLKKTRCFNHYIKLNSWWQRFILKEYLQDMGKYSPQNKEKYTIMFNALDIETIEKLSNGIAQESITNRANTDIVNRKWDSVVYNRFYVTRRQQTNKINDCFLTSYKGTINFTIHGIAGSGKTQIARNYFIENCQKYAIAFYFNAEYIDELVKQYSERLIKYKKISKVNNNVDTIASFIQWIEEHPSSLLVYDNVDDYVALETMLPNIGKHRILITSRVEHGINRTEASSMTPSEASDLLERILKNDLYKGKDLDKISVLVKELCYFPLAIAQAGATISEKYITITQYLENFKVNREEYLMKKTALPWKSAKHQSLYITWLMTKEKLRDTSLAYKFVLQAICTLPPNEIEHEVIIKETNQLIQLRSKKHYYSDEISDYTIFLTFFTYPVVSWKYTLMAALYSPIPIKLLFPEMATVNNLHLFYLPGLIFIALHQLALFYENNLTLKLINDVDFSVKKLQSLGIISNIDFMKYSIHRLIQEIIISENEEMNLESAISKISTLSDYINKIYIDNKQSTHDLDAIKNNTQHLLKASKIIEKVINQDYDELEYIIKDDYYSVYSVSYGAESMLHRGDLKGVKFYNEIFSYYIRLNFQFIKILFELKELNQCVEVCNRIVYTAKNFYNALCISDKVIFFDYFKDLHSLTEEVSILLNRSQNESHNSLFNFPMLYEMPKFSANKIDRLPGLKDALNTHLLNLENKKMKSIFYSMQTSNEINFTKWLIENLPLSTGIDMCRFFNPNEEVKTYLYAELGSHHSLLFRGELNRIMKEYYPVILIENVDAMLLASTEWWLEQKNVRQLSPFDALKNESEEENLLPRP